MLSLFFSYSHRDQKLRDELEIHLAMLKREGTIEAWHDGRIAPGADLDGNIKLQLENSDIVLLLVSPHFLASNYCYDVEMGRAMERHASGATRVIPVILEPCDWKPAPFGCLRATPTDGKPIAKFANLNEGLSIVTQDIRRAAEELMRGRQDGQLVSTFTLPTSGSNREIARPRATRSSNLRIKQVFSDKNRDDYLDEAFDYAARYFEGSLEELGKRNSGIEVKFKRLDATHFEASIFRNGKRSAYGRVWRGDERGWNGGICYSSSPSSSDSSYSESMSVKDDGYVLGLTPTMGMFHGVRETEQLTVEGAAEHLWGMLLQNMR